MEQIADPAIESFDRSVILRGTRRTQVMLDSQRHAKRIERATPSRVELLAANRSANWPPLLLSSSTNFIGRRGAGY